jgi:predicted DNA-binding antitoxin AbrB/MazE fold protein
MMSEITAIYENGILRPLAPLNLSDGQQVRLQVLLAFSPSDSQIEQALTPLVEAGLLSLPLGREDIQAISEEQLRELTQSLQKSSSKPLSEIIIEDRGAL